jgi:ubiquinone/menaquinone biosynthesis C-methylase UbiE
MSEPPDIKRLREEYTRREKNTVNTKKYALKNEAYKFLIDQRRKSIRKLLNNAGNFDLKGKAFLDIGCGKGDAFRDLVESGAQEECYFGIDLLFDRLLIAKKEFPQSNFICCDAQYLPFPDMSFAFCLQFTAFSSLLDIKIKQRMAKEMLRIIRHTGFVLWYDFLWNPTNLHTRGIALREISQLYQPCTIRHQRITLAPPIARIVIKFSSKICSILERLRIMNSHILAGIHPNEKPAA